jgi:hypothetical protein
MYLIYIRNEQRTRQDEIGEDTNIQKEIIAWTLEKRDHWETALQEYHVMKTSISITVLEEKSKIYI